jgi:hypothetical protein
MKHLHHLVETQLEAPALAWNMLTWYWGMSAFGLGPTYKDYMQSDHSAQSDLAFNDPSNDALNQISGLSRRLTIKERFDRAVNFYAYCYEQGMKTSINPPFDEPPTVDELLLSRLRSEPKTPPPDKLIQASSDSLLTKDQQKLWAMGEQKQREQRAQAYNARVLDTLQYVASEIRSCTQLLNEQLSQTGFLVDGLHGTQFNVTVDLMDETMLDEVQDNKFGDCYIQPSSTEPSKMALSGIFGAYYTMGHNIELAMFDEESKTRLSSIHHAILHTWRQLYDLSQTESI